MSESCSGLVWARQEPKDSFAKPIAILVHFVSPGAMWEGAPSYREKAIPTNSSHKHSFTQTFTTS